MSRNLRFKKVFDSDKKLLSVFTTAGYPKIDSAKEVLLDLEKAGVDFVELGFPFSDPVADGETIQQTSDIAIKNGMNLNVLFSQLAEFRDKVNMPIVIMGYLNPIVQFGVEKFFEACSEYGVDGLIVPDLPLSEYKQIWKPELEKRKMSFIFLVTPQTSDERVKELDAESDSFIYAVSSQAVTGGAAATKNSPEEYYKRLVNLDLRHPVVVGFGISDKSSYDLATKHLRGAIIGSAFLRAIGNGTSISEFVAGVR